jgi:predicted SAM-dependent methyltransferase
MKLVEFRDKKYPAFITQGNHARFIMPIAKEVLKHKRLGVDVGCKFKEWAYPGAILVDVGFNDEYHANSLPNAGELEYIFSSHCLEHIEGWERTIEYWYNSLQKSGILFLYLPHTDCEYWDVNFMPTRRHVNNLNSKTVQYIMKTCGFKNVFASERDAAYSFCVYGEK